MSGTVLNVRYVFAHVNTDLIHWTSKGHPFVSIRISQASWGPHFPVWWSTWFSQIQGWSPTLPFQCELETNTDMSQNTASTKPLLFHNTSWNDFFPANSFISDENIHSLAYLLCWVSVLTGSLSMSPHLKLFPWERWYKERKGRRGSSVLAQW